MDPASVESAFGASARPATFGCRGTMRTRADDRPAASGGPTSDTSSSSAESRRIDGRDPALGRAVRLTTPTAPAVTDFQVHLAGAEHRAEAAEARSRRPGRTRRDGRPIRVTSPVGATRRRSASRSSHRRDGDEVSAELDLDRLQRPDGPCRRRGALHDLPERGRDPDWKRGTWCSPPASGSTPGARYTINVIGAHDLDGNALGGDATSRSS